MKAPCESCGMPIETGPYCHYCVDDQGKLQEFNERFERMVQWAQRHEPNLSRPEAEAKTKKYMATMPAWREHPMLRGLA